MQSSTDNNVVDDNTKELSGYVREVKSGEAFKEAFMTIGDHLDWEREEGRIEGRLEGIAEERKNTERERQRAEKAEEEKKKAEEEKKKAEARIRELEKELAMEKTGNK